MNHRNISSDDFPVHIPRVALSTYSSSNTSFTKNNQKWSSEENCESEESVNRSQKKRKQMYSVHKGTKPVKPKLTNSYSSSSNSSISSNNQSNKSFNSLLLSVENLDNFNRCHPMKSPNIMKFNSYIYNTQDDQRRQMMENIKNILAVEDIDLMGNHHKNCEKKLENSEDSISISTTNFTVVTFNDKNQVMKTKSICRRSHQVTILILAMTIIFVIGIFALVCALEMRFQNMPR